MTETDARYYTGIGSRETPAEVLELMVNLARRLGRAGWIVRSGGADGADAAFYQGSSGMAREIYVPWASFGALPDKRGVLVAPHFPTWEQALQIAEHHHPAWPHLKPAVRALMARNVYQVMGSDLKTPSRGVVCWAPKPKRDSLGLIKDVQGGTGLAVRLAYSYGIMVYHLDDPEHRAVIESWMDGVAQTANAEAAVSTIVQANEPSSTHPTGARRWARTPVR